MGDLLRINDMLIYNNRASLSEEEKGILAFLVIFYNSVSTLILCGCCDSARSIQ